MVTMVARTGLNVRFVRILPLLLYSHTVEFFVAINSSMLTLKLYSSVKQNSFINDTKYSVPFTTFNTVRLHLYLRRKLFHSLTEAKLVIRGVKRGGIYLLSLPIIACFLTRRPNYEINPTCTSTSLKFQQLKGTSTYRYESLNRAE